MTILETLGFFLQEENIPPGKCPSEFEIETNGQPEILPDFAAWAVHNTILASLSGAMEDATTGDDLKAAVEHGGSLCSAGLVDREGAERELQVTLDALAEWNEKTAGVGGIRTRRPACGGVDPADPADPATNPPLVMPRRIRPAGASGPG